MTLRYLTPAEEELREIISYYNDRQKSLGGRFWKGYLDALEVLKAFPEIGPEVDRERKIRKFVFSSPFPYSILYGLEEDTITIIAVAHQSRKPRYWRDRLDPDAA